MTVLLGGRVAEEIVFGAITTGASDDLKRVAEISRAMVHEYAMGTSITSRQVSAEGGAVSDRTRQLRDEEQQHLTDEAMRGAARLITEHRDKLDELASALLRNEVLEREDIDRIMDGVPRLDRSPGDGLRVVAAAARTLDSRSLTAGSSSSRLERPMRWQPDSLSRAMAIARPTSARCSSPARSAPSSSRSSASATSSRSATRAWRASPRRPAWSRCRPTSRSPPPPAAACATTSRSPAGRRSPRAGEPPHGRLLFVNVAPDALGHPGLLELAERLPSRLVIELTEQDAVQNIALHPGAAAPVDRPRRARRGRRRRRRLHVARVRRRDPPRLPQALAAAWSPASTSTPRAQAVLRATVAFAREVGARVVAEGVERPEELAVLRAAGDRLRPGLAVRPPRRAPGRRSPRPAAAGCSPPRPRGGRLERDARPPPATVRDACEPCRRAPRPPRPAAERLPRAGRPPALPGRRAATGRSTTACRPTAGVIGRTFRTGEATVRRRRRRRAATSCRSIPAVRRRDLRAAARRRPRRRRAQRRVADRARRGHALARSSAAPTCSARRIEELGGRRGVGLARPAPGARRRAAGRARGPRGHRARDRSLAALELAGFESGDASRSPTATAASTRTIAEGPFAVAFAELAGRGPRRDRRAGSTHGTLLLHGRRDRRPRLRRPRGAAPRRRRLADRAAARRRRASGSASSCSPTARRTALVDRARRAARAARPPGRQRPAHGRRRARAARARRARSADRARPPRRLLRGAAGRCATTERRCALLIADVDGFKSAQRHARPRGGRRRRCARWPALLRAASPTGGRAFRIGGDEFALVFECDGEARRRADRLGAALAGARPARLDAVRRPRARRDRRDRRGRRRARRRGALRGQAPRPRRRQGRGATQPEGAAARTVTRSRPPRADLAVDVELGARPAGRPRPRGRARAARRAAARSCACAGPRRGGRGRRASRRAGSRRRARRRRGRPRPIAGAAAERAADGDDHLPGVVVEHASARRRAR